MFPSHAAPKVAPTFPLSGDDPLIKENELRLAVIGRRLSLTLGNCLELDRKLVILENQSNQQLFELVT